MWVYQIHSAEPFFLSFLRLRYLPEVSGCQTAVWLEFDSADKDV